MVTMLNCFGRNSQKKLNKMLFPKLWVNPAQDIHIAHDATFFRQLNINELYLFEVNSLIRNFCSSFEAV